MNDSFPLVFISLQRDMRSAGMSWKKKRTEKDMKKKRKGYWIVVCEDREDKERIIHLDN